MARVGPMEGAARLRAIDISDSPQLWSGLGFAVDGTGRCRVSGVALRLGGPTAASSPGLGAWAVEATPDLTELPVATPEPEEPEPRSGAAGCETDGPLHPNGVVALDHLVVTTPDLDRTVAAFEASGLALRRVRQAGGGVTQAFFRIGPVIIEVVSRAESAGTGPSALWGLAFTVADLDATATFLGDRLRPARPAVQPGRRIATLDRAAGSAVPMVFMSPHPGREPAARRP